MRGDKECMKGNYTYLNHTLVPALSCCSPRARMSAHMCLCACVCPPALLCETLRVSVCVFALVCECSGGCEAVQSPGRTEWIYKLMEFKASSIDYHYNKQQHTECLIIFRQRFCALSSNSADAVTLSDICL